MHNSTLTPMNAFTWVFLAALAAATATQLWLSARQIRHVRAHRDTVPPMFAATIPAQAHQKAADYTVAKARLSSGDLCVETAMVLALTLGGVFGIEQRFGFNRMTWRLYLSDLAKQTALAIVLGVPLVLALLWLMQHMGSLWWLYAWLVLSAFTVVLQLLFPAVILPLFNKLTPLPA